MEYILNKEIASEVKRQLKDGIIDSYEILINTEKRLVLKDELGIRIYEKQKYDKSVKIIRLFLSNDLNIILNAYGI